MSFPKLSWGREKHDLAYRWPKGPDGTPGSGTWLYGPSSMLEDAKNLIRPIDEIPEQEDMQ